LRGDSTGKGPDFASLKLKVAARCRDPKLLVDTMKSSPGLETLNNRDCALEGSELFGSVVSFCYHLINPKHQGTDSQGRLN
jgi:hypothetical protein